MRVRTLISCLVIPAAGLTALSAAPRTAGQFASSVDLVEVYATVADRAGNPVRGLKASDFEVLEDGRRQDIQAFSAGDFPLALAFAIDHSASMAGDRLRLAAGAARRFLGRLRPEDEVMLIGVSGEVGVLAPLSRDRAAQHRALDALKPWSTTSLYDALVAGIGLIQPAPGRRALIVLSDGEDRYSEATPAVVLDRARRSDVLVYPIAIDGRAPAVFAEIASLTGGRSFTMKNPKALDEALNSVAADLREQYLLGYAPAPADGSDVDGGWRSIEVRVPGRDVRIRARDGYYGGRRVGVRESGFEIRDSGLGIRDSGFGLARRSRPLGSRSLAEGEPPCRSAKAGARD